MKQSTAEKINVLMLQLAAKMDDSIAFVRDIETKEDSDAYRDAVSKVMASLYLDVLEKIWTEHPSLRPAQMDGPYVIDPSINEPRFYDKR